MLSKCYKKKRVGVSKYTAKETDGKHFKIEMSLSELKLSLGVVNAESSVVQRILKGSSAPDYDKAVEQAIEKSFNRWSDFRKRVIDTAVNEINTLDNGIMVSYEAQKGGIGAKVYGLVFYVDLIDRNKKKEEEPETTPVLNEDEKFEVQCPVKTMVEEPFTLKDIRTICDAAEYDMKKIKSAYDIACSSATDISNLIGLLVKAIKDGYTAPVTKKAKTKKKNK